MCPLRVILIFLSATIAGFFLIRGLKAEPDFQDDDVDDEGSSPQGTSAPPFQGWIGYENRILDNGGHGKRAVPLADPCFTTGKM